ncbi:MAG: 50S ribosomal protein L19e [Candidatus Aenigmarchaeota archaeon]|nr:50S ribosomal protein L19e [Candidatus Aenigmarchaeota archaeon]
MDLKSQKLLASRILKCGYNRIWIDPIRMGDVSNALTSADIRRLVKDGVIKARQKRGISSFRIKKAKIQKKRGRRKGIGIRLGKKTVRTPAKKKWINKIRALRKFLKQLRSEKKIKISDYRNLYKKAKGGLFHNKTHLKTYIERNKLSSAPIELVSKTEIRKQKRKVKINAKKKGKKDQL